jgi:hypothetical protein
MTPYRWPRESRPSSKARHWVIDLAGGLGFEPRLAESESYNLDTQAPTENECRHIYPRICLLFS